MLYSVLENYCITGAGAVLVRLEKNIAAVEVGKGKYNKNKKRGKQWTDLMTLTYSDIEMEARTNEKSLTGLDESLSIALRASKNKQCIFFLFLRSTKREKTLTSNRMKYSCERTGTDTEKKGGD